MKKKICFEKNREARLEAKLKKKKKLPSNKNIIKDLKKKLNDATTQVEEDKRKIK